MDFVIVGITTIVKVRHPAITEVPFEPFELTWSKFKKKYSPNRPKIIEGVEFIASSIKLIKLFTLLLFKYSQTNRASIKESGKDMTRVMNRIIRVKISD
jgi:hypothetical protein